MPQDTRYGLFIILLMGSTGLPRLCVEVNCTEYALFNNFSAPY